MTDKTPTISAKDFRAKAVKQKRGKHRRNKTEEAFWQMQLLRKRAGEIQDCQWEPYNLRLADNTYYKVDCLVLENDGTITLYEVKGGFYRDDARVKTKVAARLFYYYRFIVAVGKKSGGSYTWEYEEIPA